MVAALLGLGAANVADAASFSYSYSNPYEAHAQTYIHSMSNVELHTEGTVRHWKPATGGTTIGNTTPGVITYKFDFGTDIVGSATLKTNNPTFHWSYSQGHNYFFGSKNGSDWVQMLNVTPPAYGTANVGVFNGLLPDTLLGGTQLWFKAELYSYGRNAPFGGVWTNTAQHSRWDVNHPNAETFKLEVDFAGGPDPIPVPAALPLLGLGLAVFGVVGRRQRKHVA